MQAVVNISGHQYKVSENDELVVPRLASDPDASVTFDDVVMTIDGDAISTGGGTVNATVLEHGRGDKVLVFHKKRRKGMRRLRGHRQGFTKVRIDKIAGA